VVYHLYGTKLQVLQNTEIICQKKKQMEFHSGGNTLLSVNRESPLLFKRAFCI